VFMVKVKICGLTNLEDARLAVEVGADLLGFIFYEPSPRYVAPAVAGEIVLSLKQQFAADHREHENPTPAGQGLQGSARPRFIGVFVNTRRDTVERILDSGQLDAAQLHGEESPEFVDYFRCRAFKALRPKSSQVADRLIKAYAPNPNHVSSHSQLSYLPDLLIDAYHPTLYGGTGHVTDWSMAAAVAQQHSILLAGSLTPTNVTNAIRVVQPWGVDVSSGVEIEPGKKDHGKVREFISAAKGWR
jgi:phosphoribosylanthranilate isomerase